jgi:hypothetical protein
MQHHWWRPEGVAPLLEHDVQKTTPPLLTHVLQILQHDTKPGGFVAWDPQRHVSTKTARKRTHESCNLFFHT